MKKVFNSKKIVKRIVATFLLSAIILASPGCDRFSKALAADKKEYVSEVVLSYGKSEKSAKKWLSDNGYKAVEGDINDGTDGGAYHTTNVVLMGYKTTTDENKAIRNMAVMGMSGGYEVTDMNSIIKQYKNNYQDRIDDFIALSQEYKKNYKIGIKSKAKGKMRCVNTLKAHDMLNKFIEDDSKKGMGDFLLMDFSDKNNREKLLNVLIQSSQDTQAILENIMLMGAGDSSETWLNNIMELNKNETYFSRLKRQKKTAKLAREYISNKYGDELKYVTADLKEFRDRVEDYEELTDKMVKESGKKVSEITNDDIDKFFKINDKVINEMDEEAPKDGEKLLESLDKGLDQVNAVNEESKYMETASIIVYLGANKYADKTLLEYFMQDPEDDPNLLYEFGAIFEAMTSVQAENYGENINLFTAIKYAISGDDELWSKTSKKDVNAIDDVSKDMDKISVYDGVNREMFEGGVALTQAGQTSDKLPFNSTKPSMTKSLIVIGACTVTTLLATTVVVANSIFLRRYLNSIATNILPPMNKKLFDFCLFVRSQTTDRISKLLYGKTVSTVVNEQTDLFLKKSITSEQYKSFLVKYHRITYGITIAIGVAIVVISLAFSIKEIFNIVNDSKKYYSGDYSVDIPRFMVDLNYNENDEVYFNYYEAARCNRNAPSMDGEKKDNAGLKDFGDINGDTGKQWVALYTTKDKSAGKPILAGSLEVVRGNYVFDEKYKAISSFNEPATSFNFTSMVYCYADDNEGTYVRYKTDDGSVDNLQNNKNATSVGSIFNNTGKTILIVSTIAGILLGFAGARLTTRKKKEE
ncbi:MAG: hypothetical protein K6D02_08920 [Lachnospiraceae bacterium]|nr:hypothetical protein [Lachnospiraceae bacterium]